MSILKYFGLEPLKPETVRTQGETDTVRRIVETLDRLDPDQARYVAAFAYILSRVARADLCITPEETSAMERILTERGGLSEPQAVIVVQVAKAQNLLFGGTENFLVTREFNKIATREQKLALLACLFEVSASDDSISTAEDNEVRKIAGEIDLEHRDFIAVRYAFRDRLSVLKKRPGSP